MQLAAETKPDQKTFDDIHEDATRAHAYAQGVLLMLEDGGDEAMNAVYVLAQQLQTVTGQLRADLDSVNRPKGERE